MKITVKIESEIYEHHSTTSYQFKGDMLFDLAHELLRHMFEFLQYKETKSLKPTEPSNETN